MCMCGISLPENRSSLLKLAARLPQFLPQGWLGGCVNQTYWVIVNILKNHTHAQRKANVKSPFEWHGLCLIRLKNECPELNAAVHLI